METIPFEKLSSSFDFDLEMMVLAKVEGLRIAEIAIPTIYAGEKSHLNPIKYGFDVLSASAPTGVASTARCSAARSRPLDIA
jgi:hypothetical protein